MEQLTLTMNNVEHGSSIHLWTPNKTLVVIDLGSSQKVSPMLNLKKEGIRTIDELVITHPHLDHINDILNLIKPKVLTAPHLTPTEITGSHSRVSDVNDADIKLTEYIKFRKSYNRTISPEENPSLAQNNGGVHIKSFHPINCPTTNLNDQSIVTTINFRGTKILIPGDNEECSWKELLRKQSFRDAITDVKIFIASHHGRESGYYAPLFDYFKPDLTLISDGRAVDTSATDRYSAISSGWPVYKKSTGKRDTRYCLTTRNDGTITVAITPKYNRNEMEVTIG